MSKNLKYTSIILVVLTAAALVYFLAVRSGDSAHALDNNEQYTCSMHPQIIRDKPGSCPICGMALVLKVSGGQKLNMDSLQNVLRPSDRFIVGNFKTITVKDTAVDTKIQMPGIISYDPTKSISVSARVNGRIEKIYVTYAYQRVTKGQRLLDIYSPELLTEQQNYIYITRNDASNKSLINAAAQKLKLYGMTARQIEQLRSSGKASPVVSIYSPASGVIQSASDNMETQSASSMQTAPAQNQTLNLRQGEYITKGSSILKILGTDTVWAEFNIPNGSGDIIKSGASIAIRPENQSDTIDASIDYIEPQLAGTDKTSRIRVYLNNLQSKFPVGLRLTGIVRAASEKSLWLPVQSLVSTGSKRIAFKKMKGGFRAVEVHTGLQTGSQIQVIGGLTPADTIAENAQYLIDSESFIKTQ